MSPEYFSTHRIVETIDLDRLGHVNNVVYLQWIQGIAEQHWVLRASSEQKENNIWVVLKHVIEYKKPAYLGDRLTLETHVGETSGPRSIRMVEVQRSGVLLVKAETEWCLLDANTRRPRRVTDELKHVFYK